MAARGSIGATTRRLLTSSISTTVRRPGKRRLDRRPVAALEAVGEIARRFVPEPRRPGGERRRRIDDRLQRPVLDLDPLGRVARLLAGLGDDERHRIADMAHPAARQRMARRHDHRRDRRDLGDARQRADPVGVEIGFGEDAAHARHRARGGGVDPSITRMRMRRAQDTARAAGPGGEVLDIAPRPVRNRNLRSGAASVR